MIFKYKCGVAEAKRVFFFFPYPYLRQCRYGSNKSGIFYCGFAWRLLFGTNHIGTFLLLSNTSAC